MKLTWTDSLHSSFSLSSCPWPHLCACETFALGFFSLFTDFFEQQTCQDFPTSTILQALLASVA